MFKLCNQNSIQQFVEDWAVFSWLNRDFSLLLFCLHPDKWKEPEARVHVNPTSELSQGDNGTMGGVIYQILPRSALMRFYVQSHANIHMNRTVFTGPDIPQMIFQSEGDIQCTVVGKLQLLTLNSFLFWKSSSQWKLEIGSQTDLVEGVDYPYF